ncbi:MAG: penicillin-binding protein 2, partial [Alphaproteobacteria bacterium]|nr:penicillin-binding protein 2 [Alphaproteobacteria bacterium]
SRAKYRFIPNNRAEILDRNGHVLATNVTLLSLFANPNKIIDPRLTAQKLKTIIKEIDVAKLEKDLSSDKTFVWVKRDLSPEDQERINALGLTGLFFEEEPRRLYTQGKVASHIIGYVDRDNKGIAGIEKYFDKQLLANTGENHIKLSIDYRVQNIVSEELDNVITKFSALGGSCIVTDVTSGEILAMVSKPDFDPHAPGAASSEALFNRASYGVYEIGSVMKIITFAIGFDTETIQINDVYNIHDFVMNKFKIKDYHRHDGWNTVPQLFMNSSNIGAGTIALEIGKNRFREYIEKLGLTQQLKLEIAERGIPLIPDQDKIRDLNLVTMSYGYGCAITPAHFVQAMIPIVNGGVFRNLSLLKSTATELAVEEDSGSILNIQTSINILKLMRLAVEKGTAKKGAVKGYLVAGKTGTANKLGPRGYMDNHRYSSFVSVMHSINPKYLVFILLDDPKGIKETFGFATAGFTAAPAASKILERMGSLYGIPPIDEDSKEIKEIMHVDYEVHNEI